MLQRVTTDKLFKYVKPLQLYNGVSDFTQDLLNLIVTYSFKYMIVETTTKSVLSDMFFLSVVKRGALFSTNK